MKASRINILSNKKAIKRILLIRFGLVGDVLLTTPVVATLRKHFPKARIVYLTEKVSADVLRNNPDINEVWILARGVAKKMIADKPYDLVINFDWFYPSQALSFLSGAKYRVDFPVWKRLGQEFASRDAYHVTLGRLRHRPDIIDQCLNLTRSLGLKDHTRETGFYLTGRENNFAASYLKALGFKGTLIVGMHPGGHREKSLWPARKFSALADRVVRELSAAVLIFQGPGERARARKVYLKMKRKRDACLVQEFPLRKYASLVKRCDVFIAHDRGPMHIAVSLGVKTIGIFTTPEADEYFPYKEKLDCGYLEKNNAKLIGIGEVLNKIKLVLNRNSAVSHGLKSGRAVK